MNQTGSGNEPARMRAVGVPRFGGPEVLEIIELPMLEPGPGEVRIRVAAAAVNPTDTSLRESGRHGQLDATDAPFVPGMELAGTVDAVGAGVGWKPGDAVMAIVFPGADQIGAQAEFVVVSADSVAHAPKGASMAEAATLPMNGLTARQALDILAVSPGECLAITGAAGAVGGYAIQLAKAAGVRVIADAKPEDEELVRRLGADVVVPRGQDVAAAIRAVEPDGVPAALDAALIGAPLLAAVRDGGKLVSARPFKGESERDITVTRVLVTEYLHAGDKLAELGKLAEDGALTLRVADTMPPERVAEAHRKLAAGGARGRLVLTF